MAPPPTSKPTTAGPTASNSKPHRNPSASSLTPQKNRHDFTKKGKLVKFAETRDPNTDNSKIFSQLAQASSSSETKRLEHHNTAIKHKQIVGIIEELSSKCCGDQVTLLSCLQTKLKVDQKELERLLQAVGDNGQNILHTLVNLATVQADADTSASHILLIETVVALTPKGWETLVTPSDTGVHRKTPLRNAIDRGCEQILQCFIRILAEHQLGDEVQRLLSSSDAESSTINSDDLSETLLHSALRAGHTNCAFTILEYISDPKIVARADPSGNTPLHLSVDPRLWGCRTDEDARRHVELLEELIRKAPDSLRKRNRVFRENSYGAGRAPALGMAPFQYHRSLTEVADQKNMLDAAWRLMKSKEIEEILKGATIRLAARHDDITELLYGPDSSKWKSISFILSETECSPDMNPKNFSIPLEFETTLKHVYIPSIRIPTSDHTDDQDDDSTINAPHGTHTTTRNSSSTFSYAGIFNWLHSKGVRKIIKVVVTDGSQSPHCDDDIIRSLCRFDVEELDWKKIDLCSETVKEAAKNVRELVLHTSGNRAVLWGWSALDGLLGLQKLSAVTIEVELPAVILPLDTRTCDRITANMKEFKERFVGIQSVHHGGYPSISKDPSENGTSRDNEIASGTGYIEQHTRGEYEDHTDVQTPNAAPPRKLIDLKIPESWKAKPGPRQGGKSSISCGEATNSWVKTLSSFSEALQSLVDNEELPSTRTIRIALLDDGVDLHDKDLRRIAPQPTWGSGQSFCYVPTRQLEGSPSPYWVSSRGHGTEMAKLILSVFPDAELLIVKLGGSEVGRPTAESAAKAIQWAVEHKVDVISASWAIPRTDDNARFITELDIAVFNAHKEKILIFCAASDVGVGKGFDYDIGDDYPAKCDRKVFCIGAATVSGARHPMVGSQIVHYCVPGQYVPATAENGQSVTLQGSSIATALAAGLAGLILYCVSLSERHRDMLDRVKTRDGMQKVLDSLRRNSGAEINLKHFDIHDEIDNPFGVRNFELLLHNLLLGFGLGNIDG